MSSAVFEGVEFTDRYGGRRPSSLRACMDCDAMGCNPVHSHPDAENFDDQWEFVTCSSCHGTARVSWLRTVVRVPRWLVRGVPFVYRYGIRREFYPEGARWKSMKIAVGCAYLVDLGLWKP
jgi:hypothetical protein